MSDPGGCPATCRDDGIRQRWRGDGAERRTTGCWTSGQHLPNPHPRCWNQAGTGCSPSWHSSWLTRTPLQVSLRAPCSGPVTTSPSPGLSAGAVRPAIALGDERFDAQQLQPKRHIKTQRAQQQRGDGPVAIQRMPAIRLTARCRVWLPNSRCVSSSNAPAAPWRSVLVQFSRRERHAAALGHRASAAAKSRPSPASLQRP